MSVISAPEDSAWFRNRGAFETLEKGPVAKSEINIRTTTRSRKMTEKGKAFTRTLREKDRETAFRNLKKEIEHVRKLYESPDAALETFLTALNQLDLLKNKLNEAHEAYDSLLDTEAEREASYRWFDFKDRDFTDCRLRLSERIRSLEKSSYHSESSSHVSGRSQSAKMSQRSSVRSVSLARAEAATKAARFKVEMQFLEMEKEYKRLQLEKEYALAKAEERALKTIEQQERQLSDSKFKPEEAKGEISDQPNDSDRDVNDSKVKPQDIKREITDQSNDHEVKGKISHKLDPKIPPFIPSSEPGFLSPQNVSHPSMNIEVALSHLVSLQARQTELSSLLINQQRTTHLPVKEPPKFSGDSFEYPAFITAFDTIIANNVSSDKDRLFFLEKYTSGSANEAIKGFLATNSDTAYKEARKLLEQRFGNPVVVAERYKSSLRNWREISDGNPKGLQDFSDFLIRCEEAMKTMSSMAELDSSQVLLTLSAKLPSYSGIKWCRFAHEEQTKRQTPIGFKDFVKFVKLEAEVANDPIFSPDALKRERKKGSKEQHDQHTSRSRRQHNSNTSHSFVSSVTASKPRETSRSSAPQLPPCPVCEGSHSATKCPKLVNTSTEERYNIVRSKGLCFRCMKSNHLSRDCQSKSSCGECNKRHHTLLHGAKPKPKPQQDEPTGSQESVRAEESSPPPLTTKTAPSNSHATSAAHSSNSAPIASTTCRIVPVVLHHKDNPATEVKTYALLDDASDTTFITTKVQEALAITGVQTSLNLSTMHGREVISVVKIDGLTAERPDRRAKVDLPRAYAREAIPSRRDQIPTPEIARKWPHLQRIKDKIPELDDNLDVGLLIGCNCPRAIKPKEVITGRSEDPYAVRTLLGWCIVGPVAPPDTLRHEDETDKSSCSRIIAREMSSEDLKLDFVINERTKEIINPSAVSKMFELDFAEHQCKKGQGLSKEDRRFLSIAETGIRRCDDGHYELPLPLKENFKGLPNNRGDAVRRMQYLKKRFASPNSKEYMDEYMKFMGDMILNGYAERAPNDADANPGKTFYINHHGTRHPKKKKLRIVFNCSQEYNGESLNKYLIQGPLLTNNLTGVLLRFRQEPIAVTCDIEGMFHQVRVRSEHRDLLRFLWWEGNDISKEPVDYRMTVHLFGATSSPSCANFALKQTADDFEGEFGVQAANFIRKDFYVDDGLKSVPTADSAVELVRKVKAMCHQGGFNLHKFLSNSKEVIKSIPEGDRAEGVKEIDLDLDKLPLERTLGVQWCVESDVFEFNIVIQDKPCTRRGILSTVSSIYDPIGFVAPLMLQGKSILQRLCSLQLGWDDPIPEDMKMRWEKWRKELMKLQSITIPRCYKPKGFGPVIRAELHHFSDASVQGYGQCSYLRLVDQTHNLHCALVMGKSRVAPLKPVTIPRLELTAAVCSVRVSQQIHRELEYQIEEDFYWTDSKVVLGYISNESKRFHVFVSNRVQEIQDNTDTRQWRYIESENNPADEASRGMKAEELQHSQWILGPQFLWNKEGEWLPDDEQVHTLKNNDPEVKKAVAMATVSSEEEKTTLENRIERFSDWYRAQRAVALCMKYIEKLKGAVKGESRGTVQVTTEDLEKAGRLIIRDAQRKAFPNEFKMAAKEGTKENPSLKHKIRAYSPICKLDPFIDEEGILRVRGRLKHADIADKVKHPVILPRTNHVTNLIIKHYHERIKHQGKGMTLNEVRANGYWIVGGSSAVGNAIASCVTCRKLRGAVVEQKMADLPQDRLESAPPFTYCAVDYFGPFLIKEKRKELKRYGVIFTCMSSRAVHLETAISLDTDSFLNAFRRFVSRRGPVRQLRSDQGTNFVGARRELNEALAEMDHEKITSTLLHEQCDWITFKMNAPAASHMGGVWERQIRTVRNVLSPLLRDNAKQLDDESLRTLMCEAEAIVNGRPLTTNQLSDSDSPEPLTPSHLLTMKSKILLSPPGNFGPADVYARRRWRRVQHLANEFWTRWRKEYLLSMQERQKWTKPRRNMQVGDIVIVKDTNVSRNAWQLARVATVYPGTDGQVRKVQVALADGYLDTHGKRRGPVKYLERPVQKLVLLIAADE